MQTVFRIPSILYAQLFELGNSTPNISGDKLIALYSILKMSRQGEIKYYSYKAKNNKDVSGYALLRAKTGVSLSTLKKYVPLLIELNLCYFDKNGDFVLRGNKKLKDQYGMKLIPIVIGKNLIETSYNVISVRIFSKERQQKRRIRIKRTRSELLMQADNPKTLKGYKKIKRLLKRDAKVEEYNEKIVLSLEGFSVLKDGDRDNKSRGFYWKNKLKQKGLVKTTRNFEKIEEMSRGEYLLMREYGELSRKHIYRKGFVVYETTSSFEPIDLTVSSVEVGEKRVVITAPISSSNYKRKSYLEFDMIDFWVNGGGR